MSQPFSRLLHPFDITPHPSFEPEVRRAIIASWARKYGPTADHAAMAPQNRGATHRGHAP